MKNALKVLVSSPMLWATGAFATSPCKADACIDAAAASFIAPYDVFGAKCSAINPELGAQYSAIVAYLLRDEDTAILQKLRNSNVYARVRAEFESKIDGFISNEIGKACEEFLREPSAAKNNPPEKH